MKKMGESKDVLISKYMSLPYKLEIIPDGDGGYIGRYPELPGCLTSGETEEEVMTNAVDAKRSWLEASIDSGFQIPLPEESMK